MTTVKVSRKSARGLIEDLRYAAARHDDRWAREVLRDWGIPELTDCPGPAHGPDSQQDHCSICMPRWGYVGPKVVIP